MMEAFPELVDLVVYWWGLVNLQIRWGWFFPLKALRAKPREITIVAL